MYVTECICLEERGWPPRRHPDKARGSGAPVCSAMDHSTLVRSCANRTAAAIRYDTSPDKPPPRSPSSPISNTPPVAHPGASAAANSSSLRIPRNVSLICACSASVCLFVFARVAISGCVGGIRRRGTHWLGRPLLRILGSRAASLLRASRGARPGWVTRTGGGNKSSG